MGKRRKNWPKDRSLTWQMILVGLFVVVGALAWPDRYALPYPWGEPVFDAVLWSSLFILICKPLLKQFRFWISLAAGFAAQVWAAKALIVSGSRRTKGTMIVALIVWGVTYLLLMWISKNLGYGEALETDKGGQENK